ncbi:MAG: 30S ribosomal protein S8 [Candidatus Absconditicoccaceae bacterium]
MTYVNAPIHDLLIRIKNAYMARKTVVQGVVFSNFKIKILELLKQYGFVKDFEIIREEKKAFIKVFLKPVENPVNDIPEIKFYSKPSRPWYISYKDIKLVAGGKGIGIISTSQGLMPAHLAKKKQLGGELIAEIY